MKVSIIIPSYFVHEENQQYLDLCLQSIEAQTYPRELLDVIVSSSGPTKPIVPSHIKHVHSEERMHFPKATNQGVRAADADAKYLFILNDDTCLTRDCTEQMVNTVGDMDMILNPISNCDNYMRYNLAIGFDRGGDFVEIGKRFFRIKDFPGEELNLINARSLYPPGLIGQEWLPIYATLIPKKVWDKVGEIDEVFKTGQDDIDWCFRAKDLGVTSAVALHALAWHFGGVTSSVVLDNKTRQDNIEYFMKKWGKLPI